MGVASYPQIFKLALPFFALLLTLSAYAEKPDPLPAGPFPDPSWIQQTTAAVPKLDPQSRAAQRLLEVINETRWENDQLPPLKVNPNLEQAALAHSESMAQNDFFGHKGIDLSSPWTRIESAGYESWLVLAENIAAGYATPDEVVQAWMESPRHRANLLNTELYEAGVGYVFEPDDTYPGETWGYRHYWTLDMGTRWDAYPVVIEREAYSTTTRLVTLYIYGEGWAVEMRLSDDGVTWSEWQPYQSQLTWELPPESGAKTVYVQLRDAQGNVLQSVDEIFLFKQPSPPPGEPVLQVRPEQAIFVVQEGETAGLPQDYPVEVRVRSRWFQIWYGSLDQNWLRLRPPSGVAPSEAELLLTDQVALLAPGAYTATLSIHGAGETAQVPVHLSVFPQVYRVYLSNLLHRSPLQPVSEPPLPPAEEAPYPAP